MMTTVNALEPHRNDPPPLALVPPSAATPSVWLRRSDCIVEIATALAAAQAKFRPAEKKRTAVIKTKGGPEYSYKYADLSDVIDAVRPALSEHGMSFIQSPSTLAEGDAASVTTLLLHCSGQWFESTLIMAVGDKKPHTLASIITYARRYALCCMVGIATEEDDDARQAQHAAEQKAVEQKEAEGKRRSDENKRRSEEHAAARQGKALPQQALVERSFDENYVVPYTWNYVGAADQKKYVAKVLGAWSLPDEMWDAAFARLQGEPVNQLRTICDEVFDAATQNGP